VLNAPGEGTARRENESSNNKPNQNYSGATMHTIADIEVFIIIN